MSLNFDDLKGTGGTSGGSKGFTAQDKAAIYVAVWLENASQTKIAQRIGRTPARVNEIVQLRDFNGGESSPKFTEFKTAVAAIAKTKGYEFKGITARKPSFVKIASK